MFCRGDRADLLFQITARINKLCYGLDLDFVDPIEVTQKVIAGVYQGVTTVELDVRLLYNLFAYIVSLSLTEPSVGDRCLSDNKTPRLRRPRCSHRHLQLT